MKKLGVFISGNGSNLEAIIKATKEGRINGEVALVIANRKDAYGLKRAEKYGIPTLVVSLGNCGAKEAYEEVILKALKEKGIKWLILAGYLLLVGPTLLNAYKGKIINIHPSLLPAYKGLNSIMRAYEAGEKTIGVTVHFVDEGMDTGPIIKQGSFIVPENSSLEVVEAMVHDLEHRIYVEVLDGGKS